MADTVFGRSPDARPTPPLVAPPSPQQIERQHWRSTKLGLSIAGMLLASLAYANAGGGWNEHLFGEYVLGLEGFVALYVGANVWQKRATK